MDQAAVLADAFGRIRDVVHSAVDGLDEDELARRLDGRGNSIAWLIWHLARVQDDHVADAFEQAQVWHDDWVERFDLPFDRGDTGYGHNADDVAAVRASAELLLGYYDTVHERTLSLIGKLGPSDLDRGVDENWDPPVTLGVRLISVLSDDLQHAGQSNCVRGLL